MKIVCWNMKWNSNHDQAWALLRDMDADIALLQEARKPPPSVGDWAEVNPEPWQIAGRSVQWRSAVARLSDRVDVEWIEAKSIAQAGSYDFAASRPGTLAAAIVTPKGGSPLTVVSMYAAWENYSRYSGRSSVILAVSSLHRMISDLTRLVGPRTRMIAGGDLNIYRRRGDRPTPWTWPDGFAMHYGTVFDRMAAIGVPFIGPRAPYGRQPTSPHKFDSGDVLTYYTPRQGKPEKATQQLDFVFATRNIADRISVRALNEVDDWGPSDHCRILIELPDPRHVAAKRRNLHNWACDQCDVTLDTLIAGFRKRWPKDDPNKYLARIIGGHRAHHTRQARMSNAQTEGKAGL